MIEEIMISQHFNLGKVLQLKLITEHDKSTDKIQQKPINKRLTEGKISTTHEGETFKNKSEERKDNVSKTVSKF